MDHEWKPILRGDCKLIEARSYMQRPRTLKRICEEELLLSYARLDADFGNDNFARNDDFEAAVFLAAAAVLSSANGCLIPQPVVVMEFGSRP